MKPYSERDAVAVGLQTDRESVKAFEQERDPKTAALQQRRQADGSQLGARADDGGTVALCLPTPRLTQVSLIARPRPRSVLLMCVPVPCLSPTAQPDLRLCTPWVAGAYLTQPWNLLSMAAWRQRAAAAWRRAGARAAAHGATDPRADCNSTWRERAALEVRTAVGRRACCPPSAGRSIRTYYRAVGPLGPV